MRLLIAAGGTGGHIYPGIAVASEIMRRDPSSEVRFVGTARGLETQLVPKAGFQLSLIESAGLVNMSLVARARGLSVLPKSFLAARKLLKEFRPEVVVGAGGYVSGPVLLMASLSKIPTMIMESNAIPGFTNRHLARWVDRAAVSFDSALPYFRSKGVVIGNPVRREFFDVAVKTRDASEFRVLVFGGSQGARAINNAMVGSVAFLADFHDMLRIAHQTGESDFDTVSRGYSEAGWNGNAEVVKYIDNMVGEFGRADLVVSRAGATTSAELMAAGKAAIMVPLPGQMEQQRNAEEMQTAGAARMILQAELSPERLAHELSSVISSPETISQMEKASRKGAHRDAAEKAVDLVEQLAATRKR